MKRKSAVLILVVSVIIATLVTPLVILPLLRGGASPETTVSVIFPNGTNSSIGEYSISDTFTVNITVANVTDLYAWQAGMSWNPAILECLNFTFDYSFFGPQPNVITIAGTINNTAGKIYPPYAASLMAPAAGVNGSGTLAHVEFHVKGYGNSTLNLTDVELYDSNAVLIPFVAVDGYIEIHPPPPYGPTANFTEFPVTPYVNETVTFNASVSLPGFNGTHIIPITNYTWDFGDGWWGVSIYPVINHTFTAVGDYNVTLTVTCEDDPILIAMNLTSGTTWHIKRVIYLSLFEKALKIAGDPAYDPLTRALMIGIAVNMWLMEWKGILPSTGSNETIPGTVETYNTFLERGERLARVLNEIIIDPTNPPDLVEEAADAEIFVLNVNNVAIEVEIEAPPPGWWWWWWFWDPDAPDVPEETITTGYVSRSYAFVVVKEVKGLMFTIQWRWVKIGGWWWWVRCIVWKPAEYIKTIIYEYVYDPIFDEWNIEKTVETQVIIEEELMDFWWYYREAPEPVPLPWA